MATEEEEKAEERNVQYLSKPDTHVTWCQRGKEEEEEEEERASGGEGGRKGWRGGAQNIQADTRESLPFFPKTRRGEGKSSISLYSTPPPSAADRMEEGREVDVGISKSVSSIHCCLSFQQRMDGLLPPFSCFFRHPASLSLSSNPICSKVERRRRRREFGHDSQTSHPAFPIPLPSIVVEYSSTIRKKVFPSPPRERASWMVSLPCLHMQY